jgi:hypothetical protein
MTFDPSSGKGQYGAAYLCSGSTSDYSNEPMSEVNRSTEGWARYTWYKVADDLKRYADRGTVPVIEADTAGNSVFVPVTPSEIHYEGMWVRLAVARGATDVVRVASGKYIPPTEVLGILNWTLSMNWEEETTMHMGDTAPKTDLKYKKYEAKVTHHWMMANAAYTTAGGNAHSHVTLTHEPGGTGGNLVSLELVDPAALNATIDVAVAGNDIVVTLASTDVPDPAITTTGAQLAAALNCPAVLSLGVTAKVKDGETGAGIVAALAHTPLSGGSAAENYGYTDVPVILVLYNHETNDDRTEGLAIIPNFDVKNDAGKLIEGTITFRGQGHNWERHVG